MILMEAVIFNGSTSECRTPKSSQRQSGSTWLTSPKVIHYSIMEWNHHYGHSKTTIKTVKDGSMGASISITTFHLTTSKLIKWTLTNQNHIMWWVSITNSILNLMKYMLHILSHTLTHRCNLILDRLRMWQRLVHFSFWEFQALARVMEDLKFLFWKSLIKTRKKIL